MFYKKILLILSISIILLSLISCNKNDLSINTTQKTKSIESNTLKEKENEETILINKQEVINKLCSDEFEGRLVGSLGNELAEEYLNDLFGKIGLISMFGESYKHEYIQEVYKTYGLIAEDDYGEVKTINNIIRKIEGTSSNAVIISAHFDHIGIQDGKIIKGAIDNASGVAVLLDLAETLNNQYLVNNPLFSITSFIGSYKDVSVFLSKKVTFPPSLYPIESILIFIKLSYFPFISSINFLLPVNPFSSLLKTQNIISNSGLFTKY